jgi:hypothetical protein
MTTQKYQAKKVLFDLLENRVVEVKNSNSIYFDSTSEYHCYLMLCKYFNAHDWNIGIHNQLVLPGAKWKLDFCIFPKEDNVNRWNQLTAIAQRINPGYYSHEITKLWVEFKGIQDQNFLNKMGIVKCQYPETAKKIILCSGIDSAFGVYDKEKQKSHTHFIISMYNLESIIKDVIR